jgi:hypothetical protein
VTEIPISVRRDPTHTSSLVVDAIAQYSASALDLDLIIAKERACFLLFKGQNYPMVDFLSEGKPALIPSFSFKR